MIEKYIDIDGEKYKIPIKLYINDKKEKVSSVIIACHGFGGDKESSAIFELAKEATKQKMQVIAFDFPCHGKSNVENGEYFTVENCVNDLKKVYDYVKEKYKMCNIYMFSTSFGAYTTLIALIKNLIKPEKVVLRAPAIKMGEIFKDNLLKGDFQKFQIQKSIEVGFERKLNVNYNFYEELLKYDLFKANTKDLQKINIIQGTEDDIAPIGNTKEFIMLNSNKFKLFEIEGADHRFKKEGELKKVIDITIKCYMN